MKALELFNVLQNMDLLQHREIFLDNGDQVQSIEINTFGNIIVSTEKE